MIVGLSVPDSILVSKSVTFTGAANLGAADSPVKFFDTTGVVEMKALYVYVTLTLVDAVDGAFFQLGVTGDTDLWMDTDAEATDLDTYVTGTLDTGSFPVAGWGVNLISGESMVISADIILTPLTQNITGGTLTLFARYQPLSAGSSLAPA